MPNRRLPPAPLAVPPCARPSFVLFVLSLAGCGPSDEEVQALVDARVQGLQSRLEQADVIPTDAELARERAEVESRPDWVASMAFLDALDKLMDDYQPVLPSVDDQTGILSCLTDARVESDASMRAAARVLYADVQAAQKARRAAAQAFAELLPLQYRLDYDWESRVAQDYSPEREVCDRYGYDCYTIAARPVDKLGHFQYNRVGQHLYSRTEAPAPPELMARVAAAKLEVPERFSCRVAEAERGPERDGKPLLVGCEGAVGERAFLFVTGTQQAINRGDTVSVPLLDAKGFSRGVLSRNEDDPRDGAWRITAIGAALRVDEPAECPSDEEIAVKALAKVRGGKDQTVLVGLLAATPPVTAEGKRYLAQDHLRARRYREAGEGFRAIGDAAGMAAAAQGLAAADEVDAALGLLKPAVSEMKDPGLYQLLGGLLVQSGDSAGGQAQLRRAVELAKDVATVKKASAVLAFIGDAEGVAGAKEKACALGDTRSCK